ncbi:MAG: hypothetical protein COB12_12395 [Flavobacterium sp.]|nr:MAG: hypothetical protein COB12_12395 [Flavobacterium sp.]
MPANAASPGKNCDLDKEKKICTEQGALQIKKGLERIRILLVLCDRSWPCTDKGLEQGQYANAY